MSSGRLVAHRDVTVAVLYTWISGIAPGPLPVLTRIPTEVLGLLQAGVRVQGRVCVGVGVWCVDRPGLAGQSIYGHGQVPTVLQALIRVQVVCSYNTDSVINPLKALMHYALCSYDASMQPW